LADRIAGTLANRGALAAARPSCRMTLLLIGLVLFLGAHTLRMVAAPLREQILARIGEAAWKSLYSLVSLVGLVLIVYGYGGARAESVGLWAVPVGLRHLGLVLSVFSFVLIVAAYVPRNAFKARLHHPMVLGVSAWALGHLLSNSKLPDLWLFGGFLAWSLLWFRSGRARDKRDGVVYAAGTVTGTVLTLAIAAGLAAAFVLWAHEALIGVRPLG
jgi:uncharacterized membrane protein